MIALCQRMTLGWEIIVVVNGRDICQVGNLVRHNKQTTKN